jgi:type 1 glutamine amidotransferase
MPLKTLVFTRTTGYRHASIPAAVAALEKRPELMVRHSEDPADVAECAAYDVVAFVSTSGDVLDETSRDALRTWVLAGGAFVGVHCAAVTEAGWDWYGDLLGARFAGHPEGVQDGVAVVADPAHPSTEALPERWPFRDEWYSFTDVRPDLHLLVALDRSTVEMGEFAMPDPHPQAWCREIGAGRSWFTALGHTDEAWDDPLFLDHVLGGVAWAVGEKARRA